MNQRLLALGDCKSCDLAYIAQGEGSAEVDEFIMAIGFLNNKTEVAALLDGGSHVLMVSVLDDVEFPLERQRAGRKGILHKIASPYYAGHGYCTEAQIGRS